MSKLLEKIRAAPGNGANHQPARRDSADPLPSLPWANRPFLSARRTPPPLTSPSRLSAPLPCPATDTQLFGRADTAPPVQPRRRQEALPGLPALRLSRGTEQGPGGWEGYMRPACVPGRPRVRSRDLPGRPHRAARPRRPALRPAPGPGQGSGKCLNLPEPHPEKPGLPAFRLAPGRTQEPGRWQQIPTASRAERPKPPALHKARAVAKTGAPRTPAPGNPAPRTPARPGPGAGAEAGIQGFHSAGKVDGKQPERWGTLLSANVDSMKRVALRLPLPGRGERLCSRVGSACKRTGIFGPGGVPAIFGPGGRAGARCLPSPSAARGVRLRQIRAAIPVPARPIPEAPPAPARATAAARPHPARSAPPPWPAPGRPCVRAWPGHAPDRPHSARNPPCPRPGTRRGRG